MDDADWQTELRKLESEVPEQKESFLAREAPQKEQERDGSKLTISPFVDEQLTPFSSLSGTQRSKVMKRKSVEETRKGLITKAKFMAMERQRASRATSILSQRTGHDVSSVSHDGSRREEPEMGTEGPKLPVREKTPTEQWSTEELVPQWYADLDINFADEYGLLGNCIRVRKRGVLNQLLAQMSGRLVPLQMNE